MLVAGLGRLGGTPVVADRLHLRLPDGAQMLGSHVADLEAFGQWRVELVVEVRPAHGEEVADRLEAGRHEERGLTDGDLGRLRLQVVRHTRRLSGDLPRSGFEVALHGSADPAPKPVGIEEADAVVLMRSVGGRLSARRHSRVADDLFVHDHDQDIPGWIAVGQVVVKGRETRIGGREGVAVGDTDAVGDRVHGRVVVWRPQVPEGEAVDRGRRGCGSDGVDGRTCRAGSWPGSLPVASVVVEPVLCSMA